MKIKELKSIKPNREVTHKSDFSKDEPKIKKQFVYTANVNLISIVKKNFK